MSTQSFKDLIAWQKSHDLTVDVYKTLRDCKDYSFRDQIQRASTSIMNNIAEGYARRSDKAFKNFLGISKGSAAEVESMVLLALSLSYVDEVSGSRLVQQAVEVQKILTGFINKLPG